MLSLFQTKKETLIMFQKDKFWEKQKIYLWETWKKHIMCFSDFSFRNTFCVSMGKTLWKSQNVSLNGFFQGKHHPAPAVHSAWATLIICQVWGAIIISTMLKINVKYLCPDNNFIYYYHCYILHFNIPFRIWVLECWIIGNELCSFCCYWTINTKYSRRIIRI